MSEEGMGLGSSGTRRKELDTGTKNEGIQAASRYAYRQDSTVRLLRMLIHDAIGRIRCTVMKHTRWPDHMTLKALVSTLNPPHGTHRRPGSEHLAYTSPPGTHLGHQFTGTPANHALGCNFHSPT